MSNFLTDVDQRIGTRLDELAQVGGTPAGGVTRLAYTATERRAHAQFCVWAEEENAQTTVDATGNSVAVFQRGVPYFLIGSHLDTVVNGGAYDGAVGVVAALEVASALRGRVGHGVRVVAFAGEEGARFGHPTLGSSAAAGLLSPETAARLCDGDGTTMADAAKELGLLPDELEPWLGNEVACFFEIHIEQGRRLELAGHHVGVVDAIAGAIRLRLDVTGRTDHSGATPMHLRNDALAGAAEIVLAVESLARRQGTSVATVGRLEISPNTTTTVAGHARLWVDVRDVDGEQQRKVALGVLGEARQVVERRGLVLSTEVVANQPPVMLDAWPRALASLEAARMNLTLRVLPSGAGHDAAVVAQRAPSCLVFVPCRNGISHAPAEHADVGDIAAATALVTAVIEASDKFLERIEA